jgi:hypothetical protein
MVRHGGRGPKLLVGMRSELLNALNGSKSQDPQLLNIPGNCIRADVNLRQVVRDVEVLRDRAYQFGANGTRSGPP